MSAVHASGPLAGPLVAIVGPTAVGKTALGIALAERIGGEIVSADSRCVYRSMDVGTAKPSPAERARVPHHLLDLVDPDEEYSVARFLSEAAIAIDRIRARDRVPIVVGGTGYWVWSLLGGGTSAGVPPNPALRATLERLSVEELGQRLGRIDAAALAAIDRRNPRRLVRAIEVVETTGRPYAEARRPPAVGATVLPGRPADRGRAQEAPTGSAAVTIVGLTLPRAELHARIAARYEAMLAAGWPDEVRRLLARGYGRELPSMSSLGYRELAAHLAGELTLEQAMAQATARCRRYARMQYNWFRLDDPRIRWVEAGSGAQDEIARLVEGEGSA